MVRYEKAGPEFVIESHTRGIQRHPALAAFEGGFVAAWTDDVLPPCDIGGPDVRAKAFSAAGDPIRSGFRVNTETIDHQRDPKVAGYANGRFVVVWQDFSGRGGDPCCGGIKARVLECDGGPVHDEFLVNVETANRQFNATVAPLGNGDFAVAWQAYGGPGGDGVRGGVRARVFRPNGAPMSDELFVSICPEGRKDSPLVAGLGAGTFVVVWNDLNATFGDAKGSSIKAKVFGPNGATVADEFLVSSPTSQNQHPAGVAGLGDGGFVIAWTDHSGTPKAASGASIKARLFDPASEPRGEEFAINAGALNSQQGPVLASLFDGGFVVAWTDYIARGGDANRSAVKAAVFGPKGTAIGSELQVSNESKENQRCPAVAGLAGGGFVVAWEEASQGPTGSVSVKAQIFRPSR